MLRSLVARVVLLLFVASGCGGSDPYSLADLRFHAAATGLGVEEASPPEYDSIFRAERVLLLVGDVELRVYEYADESAREAISATIAADGWSVNQVQVEWIDAPHYWVEGRVIVLYLGDDADAIDIVREVLGDEYTPPDS